MGLKLMKSLEEVEEAREGVRTFQGLGVPVPASLALLLELPPVSREERARHGWSSWDHSPNMRPLEDWRGGDARAILRCPAPDSTDCARGRLGYRRGLHVWRVGWPLAQRGSHAAVGVGTTSARLQAPGYRVLLGAGDCQSWGWELGSNRLYQAGKAGLRYPQTPGAPIPVPGEFLAVLDCDQGTLGFLVDGEYLGTAFDGLKGKVLYPMVSCVWGNTSVTLTYINGLDRQPIALTDLCRRRIHRVLGKGRISELESLQLPTSIKRYLQHS
ncbi:SPRY domain-containing SOCS box protein 4-like [Mustelus asterias]